MSSDHAEGSSPRPLMHQPSEADTLSAQLSPFQQLSRWLKSFSNKPDNSLKAALEEVIEEHEDDETLISEEERTLLKNMLAFGELTVGDVMIPRTDIFAVPDDISFDELKKHMVEQRHTRIPVYQESLDNIQGFIHLKDLVPALAGDSDFTTQKLMRNIFFVPSSMKIIDLLLKMRLASCHIAIVVDEYGGTDGLVTMEDLFEEIVGDIQDEHDEDEVLPAMHWISANILEADARIKIDDLSKELNVDMINGHGSDDFDTVGGLIVSILGRVPARGEVIDYSYGMKIEVLSADPRRVKKVRLVRPQAAPHSTQ